MTVDLNTETSYRSSDLAPTHSRSGIGVCAEDGAESLLISAGADFVCSIAGGCWYGTEELAYMNVSRIRSMLLMMMPYLDEW
jgi:hypothetical protein